MAISPELSRRLADALQHEHTPDERFLITDTVDADETIVDFGDLPEEIQQLVKVLERRAIPDGSDVPYIPYPNEEGAEVNLDDSTMGDAIMAAEAP